MVTRPPGCECALQVLMHVQVINYVMTRPAREALFTVVSPEEMYKAKMCIDTVIVRLGDTVAAGLFQILEGHLHMGKLHAARLTLRSAYNLQAAITEKKYTSRLQRIYAMHQAVPERLLHVNPQARSASSRVWICLQRTCPRNASCSLRKQVEMCAYMCQLLRSSKALHLALSSKASEEGYWACPHCRSLRVCSCCHTCVLGLCLRGILFGSASWAAGSKAIAHRDVMKPRGPLRFLLLQNWHAYQMLSPIGIKVSSDSTGQWSWWSAQRLAISSG